MSTALFRRVRIAALCVLPAGLLACADGGASIVPADPSDASIPSAQFALAPGEMLGTPLRVRIDPEDWSATVRPMEDRVATVQPPQALSYDLDLTQFLGTSFLRVASVAKDPENEDVLVSVRFDHPFPAPNFGAAISAGNRADLGYTGRVLILTDQTSATATIPGEGTLKFPLGMLRNPDGFVATGDLLYRAGFTNNCFPYRLLVNEADDNRVDLSNGGSMTGNYDPAAGGWQRANAGTPATHWTGYDYIHQGQAAITTLRIDRADLESGAFEFAIALLAKYTDPRGIPGPESRFPYEPVDVTKFAYRLPFAALDASQCAWCNTLELPGPPLEKTLTVQLRDWDTGADEGADADLSDESAVDVVQPGAATAPIVELIAAPLSATPIPFTLDAGTGLPGDELAYSLDLRNDAGANGEAWCLIRARDPEWSDAAFDEYHFGVDPVTLAGDPARAIRPATYMPIRIHTWPTDTWLATLRGRLQQSGQPTMTPSGHILVGMTWLDPAADGDPAPCVQPLPFAGNHVPDVGLLELSPDGRLLRQWAWPGDAWQREPIATMADDGSVFVTFALEHEDESYADTAIDLDPGPGEDIFAVSRTGIAIIKLDTNGNYLWGGVFDGSYYVGTNHQFACYPNGLVALPGGGVAVTGQFHREIDLDPTAAGTQLVTYHNSVEWFLSVLDGGGNYVWGHSSKGSNQDNCTAPILRDNGHLMIAGRFRETVDFEPGPGTTELTTLAQFSGFKAEYTLAGALEDVVGWGMATGQNLSSRTVHQGTNGNVYVTGNFTGVNVDMDPGAGTNLFTTQLPVGNWVYISRFASDGAYEWTRVIETVYQPMGYLQSTPFGVTMSANDDLYFVYQIYQGIDIDVDPGPGVIIPVPPTPYTGMWLRLTADGAYDWHRLVPSEVFAWVFGGIAATADDRLFMSLSGSQRLDFDPSEATHAPDFGPAQLRGAFVLLQPDGTF